MTNRKDTKVAIIGSGIVGRLASIKFSELQIPNILISPASEICYSFEYSESGFLSKKVCVSKSGHSIDWGNQHDVDFVDYWQPPSFSDLPGFPFQSNEIFDELQDLHRYFGISNKTKSSAISAFERFLGVARLHLKGRPNLLESRFSLAETNIAEFQVDSLHLRLNSKSNAEITYTNLAGDEQTVGAEYIVLAAGGLGNLEIFDQMCRDNKMEIPKSLGMGYVNHPKAITQYLKLRKYSRIKIQRTSYFQSWNEFNVFDVEQEINRVRQPRISLRFWEMRVQEFSHNVGNSTKTIQKIVDFLLRKIGWHRYLKVVVYFESPQSSSSCLKVQSRGQEIKIAHRLRNAEALANYYSEAIATLTKKFEQSSLIDKTCELDLDFFSLPYQDSHHYMSTTRMSTNLDEGVVDRWGQVHGIPKIFCIGTSVLPVSAVNHPTYLAAALGIRTVKRISQYITESKG